MATDSDTVPQVTEAVRQYLSQLGKKGGSRVTAKKLAGLEKARAARSKYCKQRRENKETQ